MPRFSVTGPHLLLPGTSWSPPTVSSATASGISRSPAADSSLPAMSLSSSWDVAMFASSFVVHTTVLLVDECDVTKTRTRSPRGGPPNPRGWVLLPAREGVGELAARADVELW